MKESRRQRGGAVLADTHSVVTGNTMTNEAPKAAADDTPSVNGLASGLLRIACISAPASDSAQPTSTAMSA